MSATWGEVLQAKQEKRRELVLQGKQISKRIEENGLDDGIFQLVDLNYLEISSTSLTELQSGVGTLENLTALLLCNNKLTVVPQDIGQLKKLKILNLSNNAIESVPEEIFGLSELDTLNLSMNKLTELPAVTNLTNLHVLNISNNQLSSLPEGIFNTELAHLSQILASDNEITELSDEVENLRHLNTLDLSNNKLTELPAVLCVCSKLKEINFKGNKFKDRRFAKLVDQRATKSIIDYLENIWKKENEKPGKGKDKDKKKKKKKTKAQALEDEIEELQKNIISILKFHSETGVVIEVLPAVMPVRQYIVCCVVRSLDLQRTKQTFKNFITMQTKMHDGICDKRQAATIATHDLKAVKLPLKYDAQFPQLLQIVPLFKHKPVSGEKLFEDLRREADELRKEKKRNVFSGIHKYLYLLTDKTQYPCLVDSEDTVISFPPITNSDKTKISATTTDILIEVTSSTSLEICKKVMDEFLCKMLEMGVGSATAGSVDGATGGDNSSSVDGAGGGDGTEGDGADGIVFEKNPREKLVVEQVKITDEKGNLRVIYPSRTDLNNDAIQVVRQFD